MKPVRSLNRIRNVAFPIALAIYFTALSGCYSTPSAPRPIAPSGFLQDYSKLKPCPYAPNALTYIDKHKRLSLYQMVILEPVQVRLHQYADRTSVYPDELLELAAQFDSYLHDALSGNYMVVEKPGFGVLRVRAAITDVIPKRPLFHEDGQPISILTEGIAEATIEAELLDSMSNNQVVAFVDSRRGEECEEGSQMNILGDAEGCLKSWAILLRDQLDDARGLHASSVYPQVGTPFR